MKLSTRELATLAVFGALWGLSEASLGSVLKTLNIPLSGVALSVIGLTIALVGRAFVPRRGSTLFIGVVAMLIKLFSLGGVIIGPMVGIITEAIVAEIVLSLADRPRRPVFVLTAALGVAWVMLQPFVTGPLLFGRTVFTVWLDLLDRGSQLLGLAPTAALWIVLGYLAIHLVVGGVAGWLSWDIARLLQVRLGRPATILLAVSILLLSACAAPAAPAAQGEAPAAAQSLVVSGDGVSKAFTRADLEALTATQAVFKDVTYNGVAVSALVQAAGFDPAQVKAIKAVAADGFTVNYDPSQVMVDGVIVAYARADGDLADEDGAFRMVLPGAEGKLNVRMLVELQVIK